jgi:CubicO group peptidase (beta-lactamase class C family)
VRKGGARRRRALVVTAVVLAAVLVAGLVFRPDRALATATGTIAHDLCSVTAVAHADPDRFFAENLRPRLGPGGSVAALVSYSIDPADGSVRASGPFGLEAVRAVVRPGYGCVLGHGQVPITPVPALPADPGAAVLPPIAGEDVVPPADPGLAAALDTEFDVTASGGHRHTAGVVVLHRGRVVAERYAPGVGPRTPLLGFSMTKSTIATLVGVAVQQGKLRLSDPAPVPQWQGMDDPRRAITVEQLLRMDSGLDLDEDASGFDLATQVVYLDDDVAGAAAGAGLKAPPGTRWNYSGATTALLARVLTGAVGGTGEAVQRFARANLFDPLGMDDVTLEMDATGTPIGAHYMLAPARDWARLGELYRAGGVAGGVRILPPGWSDLVATPTLDSDYGAGWWTLRVDQGAFAPGLRAAGLPPDTFYALGNTGQVLAVIPSRELVVVRMGSSDEDQDGLADVARLVVAAMAAPG